MSRQSYAISSGGAQSGSATNLKGLYGLNQLMDALDLKGKQLFRQKGLIYKPQAIIPPDGP
jgi:hypothetical protein